jgi:hypothetical protein
VSPRCSKAAARLTPTKPAPPAIKCIVTPE